MPVKHIIFQNGERYPMLLNEDGVPDFWVTLYVTDHLRIKSKQSSITNALSHLVHLQLWEAINTRSLIEEISDGNFPSDQDVYSLRDHCRVETASLKNWHECQSTKSVVKFAAASTASVGNFHTVSMRHTYNRLTQIGYFLEYVSKVVLRSRIKHEAQLTKSIEGMRNRILANRPKGSGSKGLASDPNTKAPPPKVFERFMEVVDENSPDNPFKSASTRLRNGLMFEIMYWTGFRSGELLGLQVADIDFQSNYISVIRRHDAKEDLRARQPVAKTNERRVQVKRETIDRLRYYIMEIRAKIDPAIKHPYLFVTHKRGEHWGKPLSDSAFVLILNTIKSVEPEVLDEIKRHGFRHNSNYLLSKRIDDANKAAKSDPNRNPINEKQEIQIRKEIYGWSSDKSAEVYNHRHVREQADRLMREDMDHWTEFTKKGK
ncbi:tyrosine-type recombinase/integrase [Endozoicomonas ascidiicola]|uniref:tyrosine-type recombinase/integrase n=1 Tax=Endozoicomonas ascidiicola TaxID=1698521 RepID=UPI000833BF35|nr:tyrosine-type recombinase/integrase [Endozoicomonas ascidiicola]